MKKNRIAMTLVEILVAFALLAVLSVGLITIISPAKLLGRAMDTQKKSDLSKFHKTMEEYFNDNGCYPAPDKICYPGGDNTSPPGNPCYICGKEPASPKLSPYFDTLPCDPNHPIKRFYYSVDKVSCPTMYRVYAKFNTPDDEQSLEVGCGGGGCGPAKPWGYDYGEASPNTYLNKSSVYNCLTRDNKCNNCGGPGNQGTDAYNNCLQSVETGACVIIYPSHEECCTKNPSIGCI